MTTSRYFNNLNRNSHQDLAESLIIQAIKHKGFDVYYLPRELQKEDLIYGEDVLSKFTDYHVIEMYLKTYDGFQGRGDMFKKFGIEIDDQATLQISRKRFAEEIGDAIDPARPREGDLLYFPLNSTLVEIKFVKNEETFYQLGKVYLWEIDVRSYVFSHEEIKTGIDSIDDDVAGVQFEIDINVSTGSGIYLPGEKVYQGVSLLAATASATVVAFNGKLQVTNLIGELQNNVALIGDSSGASYSAVIVNELNILQNASAQNQPLEDLADVIITKAEKNRLTGDDY